MPVLPGPPANAPRWAGPHLNIVVDLENLEAGRGGAVVDGPLLDGPTIQRYLCDAGVHRCVVAGRSTILDYGTTTRTAPAPLWNALVLRDVRCRFPHCDRKAHWCEGHHVIEFPKGTTKLANLVLLCSRHHHAVHEGWELKLLEDGELHLTAPDGRFFVTRPPP